MSQKRLWLNRIAGVCCLLLWVGLVISLSGTAGKIAGITLVLMLAIAVIYDYNLPSEVSAHLIIPAYGEKEERLTGNIYVHNASWIPILSGRVFLRVKKTITRETEEFSMEIKAGARKDGKVTFLMDADYMGFLEISILRVEIYSFFGCIKKVTRSNLVKEVMILPRTTELHFPVENSGIACSFFDEAEGGRKGDGPGEYFGIRPYTDGDSMKQIHWKLTGKTDEYMVKEIEVPMMRMPLIFLETRVEKTDAAMIDGLLEAFFSISQHMAQEGQKHCLCWHDRQSGEWNFYTVENALQLEEVYGLVFHSTFFARGNPTVASLEEEKREMFSELLYITDYWDEKVTGLDEWNMTLLLERKEARKPEGEQVVPYLFSPETLGEDVDRILTGYRGERYGN